MAFVKHALDPEMFAGCGEVPVPIRIGDKWAGRIIRCLEDGPRRFSELQVPLSGITPKVLTETLRAMERDGMISRTETGGIPRRVDYELTALGRSLLTPIAAVCEWAEAHLTDLVDAREAYEDRDLDPSL